MVYCEEKQWKVLKKVGCKRQKGQKRRLKAVELRCGLLDLTDTEHRVTQKFNIRRFPASFAFAMADKQSV